MEVFLNDPVNLNASHQVNEETIYREDQPSMSPQKLLRPASAVEISKEREKEKALDATEISKEIEESMVRMAAEKNAYERNFNSWSV